MKGEAQERALRWSVRPTPNGLAVSSVQGIWKADGLAPHRWRSFKLSNDPAFAQNPHAILGFCVAPSAYAVVLDLEQKR